MSQTKWKACGKTFLHFLLNGTTVKPKLNLIFIIKIFPLGSLKMPFEYLYWLLDHRRHWDSNYTISYTASKYTSHFAASVHV